MVQAWLGTTILTVLSLWLFWELGFSQKYRRAQSWLSLTVLYAMWTIHLGVLGRETAITTGLLTILFLVISTHRFRIENPTGKIARFMDRNKWVPRFKDQE